MQEGSWLQICPDRRALGNAAAHDVADELRRLLNTQGSARMLLAAAPSQSEMLRALSREPGIDWSRVTAFHLDEYVGLPNNAPQRFGNWLSRSFFDHVPIGQANFMGSDDNVGRLINEYSAKLAEAPIDIACLGIGDNGHIAFNEPSVADFADLAPIKVVTLEESSREQQVADDCFSSLDEVPRTAITLTVPSIVAARRIFCVAPGRSKAAAARATLLDPVSTNCPSTILRTHPRCTLYLDSESAVELRKDVAA